MTKLLLTLFAGKTLNMQTPESRSKIGKLSGTVGILCNFLLFSIKLAAGILAGSVSIMADALNNLSDAVSSVVTLLGFKLAERPADDHHPYGHARYEYLSGLAVAAMIVVIGFELAKSSVEKLIHPQAVVFTALTGGILAVSIGIKLWLMVFYKKTGKMIDSQTLEAAAMDSRNDCLTTAAVLAAGLVERITSWQVDGFAGLAVAVFILYSGCRLAKDTISPLLGEATDPQLREKIADFVESNPKVLGHHDLMVHDYGPGRRFASLHVEMDKDEDPLLCHEIIDELERDCLKNHGIHLVIHYDPVVVGDPEQERVRTMVAAILRVRDTRISIHDFRMVPGEKNTNLVFDVALPMELQGQETGIQKALDAALNDLGETRYTTVITFDPTAME